MRVKSRKSSFTAHQKKIKIEGFGLHKLISECLRYKIQIRDLHFISDIEAEMLIKASDFGKLRKLAKSRFRITVVSESGYIPFLFGLKARKAMLAGMVHYLKGKSSIFKTGILPSGNNSSNAFVKSSTVSYSEFER